MSATNSEQFSIRGIAHGRAATANIRLVGAALTNYSVDGSEIVGDPSENQQSEAYVGSTLAPWANRIAGGTWSLNGQPLSLAINEPARNAALHGLVADRPWKVIEHKDSELTLGFRLLPIDGYPFELELVVSYEINFDGLRVRSSAKNLSAAPAPFVMAFHPYYRLAGDSVLISNFAEYLVTDKNLIPVGKTAPIQELGFDEAGQLSVISTDLDHGFVSAADSTIETKLVSAAAEVVIWQEHPYRFLIVFTGKAGTVEQPGYIAIEPQTGATNAFNSGDGLIWIEPGKVIELAWGVRTKLS